MVNIMSRAETPDHLLLLTTAIVITLYSSWPRFCTGQGNSTSSNPCDTYGRCGPFGSCDAGGSPTCSCLQGFDPRNRAEWNGGNWTAGCVRRVPLVCGGNNGTTNASREDGFLKLKMTNMPGSLERRPGPANDCEGRCLRNCSCVAYAFDSTVGCMFWSGALINIQISSGGSGSDFYIRLANSELVIAGSKKGYKKILIILVLIGLIVPSISAFCCWKWMVRRRGKKRPGELETVHSFSQDVSDNLDLDELPLFKFEELANATNGFSNANELGKGGFGPVYKGVLEDGRYIAVKRLATASGQGMKEFMNEVKLISKLQHRNLVRLFGGCVENNEKMLVYEYMPNNSLDFFLFDQSKDVLDWRKRFNIIEGICRGLLYLHRDSRLKIIHRDLKPSNILLDNDWNAKISDFGMAKIFGSQQDHISTARVVGTNGYMSPEYAMDGRFSEKSDVFSFGVMMLEITTGRRNSSFSHQEGFLNLLGYVWRLWKEDDITTMIDPRLSGLSHRGEVVRCMHIGLLCVQEAAKDRPTISAMLSMLCSETAELPDPKRPAFSIRTNRPDTSTSSSKQSQKSSCSLNDVTITKIQGR